MTIEIILRKNVFPHKKSISMLKWTISSFKENQDILRKNIFTLTRNTKFIFLENISWEKLLENKLISFFYTISNKNVINTF